MIQDVNASKELCMSIIKDVGRYTGVVPHVKAVDIYSSELHGNV